MEEILAGKGRKKASLRDLSVRWIQNDHLADIFHELDNQTDRGAALIGAGLVDDYLKTAMRARLAHFKNFEEIMFENEGAPLGTFSARIKVARALNVIGPVCEGHLGSIRRVRNQFAHSVLKIDFTHPLIEAECNKLPNDDPDWKPEFSSSRRRYTMTVVNMSQAFAELSDRERGNTITSGLP